MTKDNKKELIQRVKKVKAYFKHKGISRSEFIDDVYGKIYHSEANRLINLWNCKITDIKFVKELERYAEFPNSYKNKK